MIRGSIFAEQQHLPAQRHVFFSLPRQPQLPHPHLCHIIDKQVGQTYHMARQQILRPHILPISEIHSISTPLLLDYIKSIYLTYNISDPMMESANQSLVLRQDGSRIVSSDPKLLKKKMQQQMFESRKTQVSFAEDGNSREEYMTPQKKKQQQHWIQQSRLNTEPFAPITLTPYDTLTLSSAREAESNLRITESNVSQKHSPNHTKIKQVFRYCFLCENLILQQNILHHQKYECTPGGFEALYNMAVLDIIGKLQHKIKSLKTSLSNLLESQEQSKLVNIKEKVSSWLNQIDNKQRSSESGYRAIIASENSIQMKLIEGSRKLEWFLRMRNQIKTRFSI